MRLRFCMYLAFASCLFACSGNEKSQEKMVSLKTPTDPADARVARLSEAIEKDPKNVALISQRSKLYLEIKQFEKALADAEKAISLDNSNGEFYFLKAKAQRGLNRLEAALNSAKTAETKNFASPELFILEGEIFLIIKQYQKAIDYLNQALKLSSFNEYAYFYKGLVYAESGDTARAISNLQTAVEQNPEFVDSYNELAKIHTAKKQFKEAHQYLESGIRFEPGNSFLHYNEGVNLVAQHYPDSAVTSFKLALSTDSAMYMARYNLGVIAYNKNQFADAVSNFEKVLKFENKLPQLNLLLADSYEKAGRKEDAIKYYNEVLQKTPDNVYAQKALRRLNKITPKNGTDSL
jgi:tetratricopeptide (TPR) repeat protein